MVSIVRYYCAPVVFGISEWGAYTKSADARRIRSADLYNTKLPGQKGGAEREGEGEGGRKWFRNHTKSNNESDKRLKSVHKLIIKNGQRKKKDANLLAEKKREKDKEKLTFIIGCEI